MTFRTSIRLSAVAAALVTVLVIAPAASAATDPTPGFLLPRSAPPTPVDPHGVQARLAAQQVTLPSPAANGTRIESSVPAVPDRVDGIGTARGPQVVQVSAPAESSGSFNWTDAAIGAAFLVAAALLAAFTFTSAGRRRGLALPS
jgi:hypothetical protein